METVRLIGWRKGLSAVRLTKLIRDHSALSLAPAKAAVDALLAGEAIELEVRHKRCFAEAAEALGAIVEV